MGRKGKETSIETREIVVSLHNQGKSLSEISNIVGRASVYNSKVQVGEYAGK